MNELDEIVYLIGCYLITADKEINTKEIEALDFYLQGDKNKCFLCYYPPVSLILTIYLTFHSEHL